LKATLKGAQRKLPAKSQVRTVVNGTTKKSDKYTPVWQPMRPGAEDALKVPSRMGDRLHYRDGRVEATK